jgi:hypothetical protein
MLLSFIYLIFVSLLKLLIRSGRPAQIKDIELIVLRHQLKVLRCQVGPPSLGRLAAPMTAVQAWCGHSSLPITSRYSHWRDGADDADLFGRAFGVAACRHERPARGVRGVA